MSYKYFGRLSGGSNAGSSLGATAPANTTTPFDPQSTATKFIAYGEAATALNVNRALSALSANSDYLASILDTPALRKDLLTPNRDNGVGGTSSGFVELNDVAMGTTEINLATNPSPPVWVYVGLHKDSLSDCINLFRVKDGQYINDTYPDIGEMDKVSVTDIKVNSQPGVLSFFDGQGSYTGTPEFSVPNKIPGITLTAPAMGPYNGASVTVDIASWQEDGPVIGKSSTAFGWADIFARPGCYVLVEGETSNTYNNGLYQIARISGVSDGATGDKAVLTRGGLHRVTVANGSHFNTGDRVSWKSIPNQSANTASTERENTSYVMYKILHDSSAPSGTADLYLSSFSGPEDFKLHGSPYKAMRTSDTNSTAVHSVGSMGLADQESSATQNWTMPVGTRLYKHSGGANDYSEVTAVIPAGYPITFATNSDPGNVKLCSPPGFLLNPVLVVSDIIGGDYYAHCSSLTTARERLITPGQSLNRFTYENPQDRQFFTESDANRLDAFTKFIRIGHETIASNMYPGPLSPTKKILGENLWKISIDDDGGAKDIIANGGLSVGDTLSFKQDWAGTLVTTGTLVAIGQESGTTYLIVKDVDNSGWNHVDYDINDEYGIQRDPISGGGEGNASYLRLNSINYYVDEVVHGPYLKDSTSATYVPSFGLNAAYNNHYSSSKSARGNRGLGNYILVRDGKPVTIKIPRYTGTSGTTPSDTEGIRIEVQDLAASQKLITLGSPSSGSVTRATIAHTSNSLTFDDHNTPNAIALSDSLHTALPEEIQHQSILGAFEGLRLEDQGVPVLSTSVLKGASITSINLNLYVNPHTFLYKGVIHKQAALATIPISQSQTSYVYYDFSLTTPAYAVSATYDVEDITRAYVAKVVSDSSAITEVVNISKLVSRVDERLPIYVGVPGTNVYDKSKASFETLGEALAAIDVWSTASANSDRTYTIELISDTTEVESAAQGLTFPRRIPTHGITINGNGFTVNWGSSLSDKSLFDLNGKGNLTFDNIKFNHQGTISIANAAPTVNIFTSTSSITGNREITIRRCQSYSDISSFFVSTDPTVDFGKVVIDHCTVGAIYDTAVTITGNCQGLYVTHCIFNKDFFGTANLYSSTNLNYRKAILVGGGTDFADTSKDVENLVIRDTELNAPTLHTYSGGIYAVSSGSVQIESCKVYQVDTDSSPNVLIKGSGLVSITSSILDITDSGEEVIRVEEGVTPVRIVGNELLAGSIECRSSRSYISQNTVLDGDVRTSSLTAITTVISENYIARTVGTASIQCNSVTQLEAEIIGNTFCESASNLLGIRDPFIYINSGSETLPSNVVVSGNKNICSLLIQLATTDGRVLVSDNIGQTSEASSFREWNINTASQTKVSGNLLSDKQCMRINGAPGCSVVNNTIPGGLLLGDSATGFSVDTSISTLTPYVTGLSKSLISDNIIADSVEGYFDTSVTPYTNPTDYSNAMLTVHDGNDSIVSNNKIGFYSDDYGGTLLPQRLSIECVDEFFGSVISDNVCEYGGILVREAGVEKVTSIIGNTLKGRRGQEILSRIGIVVEKGLKVDIKSNSAICGTGIRAIDIFYERFAPSTLTYQGTKRVNIHNNSGFSSLIAQSAQGSGKCNFSIQGNSLEGGIEVRTHTTCQVVSNLCYSIYVGGIQAIDDLVGGADVDNDMDLEQSLIAHNIIKLGVPEPDYKNNSITVRGHYYSLIGNTAPYYRLLVEHSTNYILPSLEQIIIQSNRSSLYAQDSLAAEVLAGIPSPGPVFTESLMLGNILPGGIAGLQIHGSSHNTHNIT